jgi:hypothetical protein
MSTGQEKKLERALCCRITEAALDPKQQKSRLSRILIEKASDPHVTSLAVLFQDVGIRVLRDRTDWKEDASWSLTWGSSDPRWLLDVSGKMTPDLVLRSVPPWSQENRIIIEVKLGPTHHDVQLSQLDRSLSSRARGSEAAVQAGPG